MKNKKYTTSFFPEKQQAKCLAVALLAGTLCSPALFAGPQGGRIVAGQAHLIQNAGTTLVHQHSGSLAIDWQSFNLAADETVTFQQPGSSASVLNRILDQQPSEIFGSINANGRVFLSNPNGIIFGESATLNIGTLVATSLNIEPEAFVNGDYQFNAMGDGRIINRGLIKAATGGSVTFSGNSVANEGSIIADYGQVNLAAGRRMTLAFDDGGLIRFEVDGAIIQTSGSNTALLNSGTLQANGGQVLLSADVARDVFDSAVNNDGIIQANRIDNSGGKIRLLAGTGGTLINSGVIDASSQDTISTGGEIQLLGERVGLIGSARLDASGALGGGEILIGGDFQGQNPDIQNASTTLVSANASIKANAIENGNGGKVIVWADEATRFSGRIEATGGAQSGDGGLVEVSGKQVLDFRGWVDTQAPRGERGALLLDPNELNVIAGASGTGADDGEITDNTPGPADGLFAFADGAEPSNLTAAKIVEVLEDTNVTLQANNQIDIEVTIDASGATGNQSLELDAPTINFSDGANILLNDASLTIGNTQAGNVALANGATVTLDTGTGAGDIAINGTIDGGGGTESLTLISGSGTTTVTGAVGGGDTIETLILQENAASSTGGVTFNGNVTVDTLTTYAQAYAIALNADASISNATTFANTGNLTLGDGSGDSTTFTAGLTATAPSSINLAGTLTANSGASTLTLGDADTGVTVTANSGIGGTATGLISFGDATINDGVTLTLGTGIANAIELDAVSGVAGGAASNLTLNTTGAVTVAEAVGTDMGTITVTQSGGTTFQNTVAAATVTLTDTTDAQTIAFQDNLTVGTGMTVSNAGADNYNVSLSGASNSIADTTAFNNGGSLTLGDGVGDNTTFTAGLTATAPSAVSIAGTLATSGDSTLDLGTTTLTANVIIQSDEIDLSGTISGGGFSITLQPDEASDAIQLGTGASGGADILALTDTEIGRLSEDTFSLITIGRSDGVHNFTINSSSFKDALALRTPVGGSVTINGQLDTVGGTADADNITINGSGATTTLNADIVTAGGVIDIQDDVFIDEAASVLLDSTNGGSVASGAAIDIEGSLNGTNGGVTETLSLDAGSAGTISINSDGGVEATGNSTPLNLTIVNSGGATFSSTVNAATVTLTDTSGTIQFDDNLTATTLNTAAQSYNLALLGGGTVSNATTFANTGSLTLGDGAGDSTTFTAGLTATTPSSINLAGTLAANSGTSTMTLGDADTGVTVTADSSIGGSATGLISFGDATINDGVTLTLGTGIANAIELDAVSGVAGGAASNLTLNTTGAVTVAEAVGTDLGTLTLTQSGGTTFNSTVDAATVTLTDTSGTIQFDDTLTATTLNTAAQSYNLALLGGGTVSNATTFANTGSLTLGDGAGDSTTFTAGLTATAPSSINLAGTLAASSGTSTITLGDADTAVTVTADSGIGGSATGLISFGDATINDGVTLTLGTGIANAIELDAVSGVTGGAASNLTLNTTGAVTVAEAVGTDLGTLTLTQSGGTTFNSTVDAATVTLTDTSGTIQFDDTLTATTLNTAAQSYNLALLGGGTVSNATTFANTGSLTLGDGAGDSTTFTAGLTATAPSSINLAGTLAASSGTSTITLGDADTAVTVTANSGIGGTATGLISFGDATINDGVTLTLGTGIANAIELDAVSGVAGGAASNLTLNTTGAVTVAEAVGTDLGTLTLTQSGGTTFNSTVNAATVTLTDTSGAIQFDNALTATTLNTAAQSYNLALLGGGTVSNATTFANTGSLTLGDGAGDSITFTAGLTATAPSSINLTGTLTTNSGTSTLTLGDADTGVTVTADSSIGGSATGLISFGDATINDGVTLTLGTGIANAIELDAVSGVAGGAASNLTLNTTGTITATGAVGTDMGTLTITQSGGTTFQSTVSAIDINLTDTTGSINFQDNLSISNSFITTGMAYDASMTGANNSIAGNTEFLNTGTLTLGDSNADQTLFIGGVETSGNVTNPSLVQLAGGLSTTNSRIVLGDISMVANTSLDSGNSSNSSIDLGAVSSNGFSLSIDAGSNASADVSITSFSGAGDITISNSGGVNVSGSVNAGTVTLINSNGTIAFLGNTTISNALTTSANAYNISLVGASNSIAGATVFNNTGTLTLGDQTSDNTLFDNGLDAAAAPSNVNVAGTLRTSNAVIDFDVINLTADTTLDSGTASTNVNSTQGSGQLTILSDSLSLGSFGSQGNEVDNLNIPDATNLTLTGNLYVNGGLDFSNITNVNIGSSAITLETDSDNGAVNFSGVNLNGNGDLLVNSGSGNVNLSNVGNSTALGSVTINSTGQTTLAGSITTQGAKGVDLGDASNIDIGSDVTITTSGSGGIDLSGGAVDGRYALRLNSDTGGILLGAMGQGSGTALNALSLSGNGTASLNGNIRVQSTTRETVSLSSQGLMTIAGAIETNSSNLTISSATTPNLTGNFTSAGGDVSLTVNGAALAVDNSIDSAGGSISLSSDTSVSIGALANLSTQDGDFTLSTTGSTNILGSLNSGAGLIDITATDVAFTGAISSTQAITIQGSNGIGLGATANGMQLDGGELASLSAPELTLQTPADILVDNISLADSATISNRIVLRTDGGANSSIRFENNPSSFKFNLEAKADDGVFVLSNLTTEGNLSLDGDANTTKDNSDNIVLGNNISLSSAGNFTLAAQNGDGLILQGDMTIDTVAGSGDVDLRNIAVNGGTDVNEQYSLTINTDSGNIFLGALGNINPLDSLTVNNSGSTTLTNNITTRRSNGIDLSATSAIIVANDLNIDSSSGNGIVNFDNTPVDGPGALSILAGNGDVTLAAIGQTTALQSLSVNSSGQTQLQGNISTLEGIDFSNASTVSLSGAVNFSSVNNASIDLSGGSLTGSDALSITTTGPTTLTGSIITEGLIDLSAATQLNLVNAVSIQANNDSSIALAGVIGGDNGLSIAGGPLSLQGEMTLTGSLDVSGVSQVTISDEATINALGIDISNTPVDGPGSLSLTATGGTVNLYQLGATTALESIQLSNSGNTILGGNITTQGTAGVDFSAATDIDLAVDIIIDTTTSNGTIDISGNAIDGPRMLQLNAGGGDVVIGSMGQTTALASLSINSTGQTRFESSRLTTQGAGILLTNATDILINGATTMQSTANDGAIMLDGGKVDGPGSLDIDAGSGSIVLGKLGLNQALTSLTVNNSGQTGLGGDIASLGDIDFSGASLLRLTADVQLNSSPGDGRINLSGGAVDGNFALTLDAGNGDIILDTLGASEALAQLVAVSSGQTALAGNITTQTAAEAAAKATGERLRRAADTSTIAVNFSQAKNILLTDNIVIDTSTGNGAVNFEGASINGPYRLEIRSGSADIRLGGAGQTSALASLAITNTGVITLTDSISADGDIDLDLGRLDQQKTITSNNGTLSVTADSGINMAAEAVSTTQGKAINYRTDQGDIRIGLLDANDGDVSVNAAQGAVLSSTAATVDVGQTQPNIKARNISITANSRIGESSQETLVLQAASSGRITLTANSNQIYINNTEGTPISSNRTIIDVLADRRSAAAESQLTGLQVNGTHEPNKQSDPSPLFRVLSPQIDGALLPDTEETTIQSLIPDVPVMVRTPTGWQFKRPLRSGNNGEEQKQSVEWL